MLHTRIPHYTLHYTSHTQPRRSRNRHLGNLDFLVTLSWYGKSQLDVDLAALRLPVTPNLLFPV